MAHIIDTREEYNYCKSRGYDLLFCLVSPSVLRMSTRLRVSIQNELFGRGHTPAENERFYRWCWEHKPHICEECMRPLQDYSAVYISHILTRGAFPEMAHDPRNTNILCFRCHAKWENGKRETMRIYRSNMKRIEELKAEYNEYSDSTR